MTPKSVDSPKRATNNEGSLDGEELRRLWREGLESGPGRDMSIGDIKNEARRRVTGGRIKRK